MVSAVFHGIIDATVSPTAWMALTKMKFSAPAVPVIWMSLYATQVNAFHPSISATTRKTAEMDLMNMRVVVSFPLSSSYPSPSFSLSLPIALPIPPHRSPSPSPLPPSSLTLSPLAFHLSPSLNSLSLSLSLPHPLPPSLYLAPPSVYTRMTMSMKLLLLLQGTRPASLTSSSVMICCA